MRPPLYPMAADTREHGIMTTTCHRKVRLSLRRRGWADRVRGCLCYAVLLNFMPLAGSEEGSLLVRLVRMGVGSCFGMTKETNIHGGSINRLRLAQECATPEVEGSLEFFPHRESAREDGEREDVFARIKKARLLIMSKGWSSFQSKNGVTPVALDRKERCRAAMGATMEGEEVRKTLTDSQDPAPDWLREVSSNLGGI